MSSKLRSRPVTARKRGKADFRVYIDAHYIVDWLNATREPSNVIQLPRGQWSTRREIVRESRKVRQARARVVRLITVLRELNTIASKGRERTKGNALSEEIATLIKPLVRLQWKFVPTRRTKKGLVGWHLEQGAGNNLRFVLLTVARLSAYGLDWLRECPQCSTWFVGYNDRSRFDSPKCKQAFESAQRKTEKGRKKWKLYMRKLRKLKRDRAAKRRQAQAGER